jgi:hypothetical protein
MDAEEDVVVVTVVASEGEAEIVCGLLRANGIKCGYRDTDAIDASLENFGPTGPREILVADADLEDARSVLAARPD